MPTDKGKALTALFRDPNCEINVRVFCGKDGETFTELVVLSVYMDDDGILCIDVQQPAKPMMLG